MREMCVCVVCVQEAAMFVSTGNVTIIYATDVCAQDRAASG